MTATDSNPPETTEQQASRYAGIPQELLLLLDLASIVHDWLNAHEVERLPLRAGLVKALIVQRAEDVTGRELDWLMEAPQ